MLWVGTAKTVITPPVGVVGICGLEHKLERVVDPLYVRVLTLQVEGQKVAIVFCDLVGLEQRTIEKVRGLVESKVGIKGENVIIHCTHTHACPWVWEIQGEEANIRGIQVLDQNWMNLTVRRLVDSIRSATTEMRKATVIAGKRQVKGIASNRIIHLENGRVVMRGARSPSRLKALPEGLIDSELGILSFADTEGCILAVVMNYACHPTSLGGSCADKIISADFPGYAITRVEEALKSKATAFFAQGAEGDINPAKYISTRCVDETRRLGSILSVETLEFLETSPLSAPPTADELALLTKEVSLPVDENLPAPSEARRMLDEDTKSYKEAKRRREVTSSLIQSWRDSMKTLYWSLMTRGGRLKAEVKVLRIGDYAVVFLPGEPFVEIGLEIKKRSKFRQTFILSNCSWLLYVPSQRAFQIGRGYGVDRRRVVSRIGALVLEETTHDLLDDLFL